MRKREEKVMVHHHHHRRQQRKNKHARGTRQDNNFSPHVSMQQEPLELPPDTRTAGCAVPGVGSDPPKANEVV